MDPNGSTKNKSGQNHQCQGPQASARQKEEPGSVKGESPRKCTICGSPNHHGCGCEAKRRINTINEYIDRLPKENTSREQVIEAVKQFNFSAKVELTEALQCSIDETPGVLADYLGFTEPEQPESEAPTDVETLTETQARVSAPGVQPAVIDDLEDILSPEAIRAAHEINLKMAKDIKTMAEGFEGLCACMYDTNNYLKLIAADLVTIKKILTKEYEVKNAG